MVLFLSNHWLPIECEFILWDSFSISGQETAVNKYIYSDARKSIRTHFFRCGVAYLILNFWIKIESTKNQYYYRINKFLYQTNKLFFHSWNVYVWALVYYIISICGWERFIFSALYAGKLIVSISFTFRFVFVKVRRSTIR